MRLTKLQFSVSFSVQNCIVCVHIDIVSSNTLGLSNILVNSWNNSCVVGDCTTLSCFIQTKFIDLSGCLFCGTL